ncbi:unnamed protein product [Mytilus edulis]|uniref:Uncharacterized protein n=1 Tax=Mytilus edulis TaxID=6550 RepID=A0A8S3V7U6_MYTED|nr:unnamed protein product [Mytilus edulis]
MASYNFKFNTCQVDNIGNADGLSRRPCTQGTHCIRQETKSLMQKDPSCYLRAVKMAKFDSTIREEIEIESTEQGANWTQSKTTEEILAAQQQDDTIAIILKSKLENQPKPKWADIFSFMKSQLIYQIQLHPLKTPPIEPIYTAVPIDEFYNLKITPSCSTPKIGTEIILLDESPLTINPPATPASPKVEPYDPEKPEMDRREVIFKEEILFYPPRKIDLNSRYGRTYDWSHLQLPSEEYRDDPRLQLSCPPSSYLKNEDATLVRKIRNKAREFSTEVKVIPDGYLGVRKEEKVIFPDGTIYNLSSNFKMNS